MRNVEETAGWSARVAFKRHADYSDAGYLSAVKPAFSATRKPCKTLGADAEGNVSQLLYPQPHAPGDQDMNLPISSASASLMHFLRGSQFIVAVCWQNKSCRGGSVFAAELSATDPQVAERHHRPGDQSKALASRTGGASPALERKEMRTGVSLGMTLLDTSGNYGNGRSEELINHVIASHRDRVFLVSKVETMEVPGDNIARACGLAFAVSAVTTSICICCTRQSPTPNSSL